MKPIAEERIDYANISLEDSLLGEDLSIERALSLLPEPARRNYAAMYQWFMDNEGTVGSRLYGAGERLPGVDPDFAHAAQRGIHVPGAKWFPTGKHYAATITAKFSSRYASEGEPYFELPNGTWILFYSAHSNNEGGDTFPAWNDGIKNCLVDGVPIGVFRQVGRESDQYMRSLAYVESFDPVTQVFTLHGPATESNASLFRSPLVEALAEYADIPLPSTEEMEKDLRVFTNARQALRTGQDKFREELIKAYDGRCAICGCDVPETLQAAHILDHRGLHTNIVQNGLLLRADLHLLYDRALVSVDPKSGLLEISDRLADSEYAQFAKEKLRLPSDAQLRPNPEYLAIHHRRFIEVELAS